VEKPDTAVGTGQVSLPIEDLPGNFLYLGTFTHGKWVTHYFEGYKDLDPTKDSGTNERDIYTASGTQVNLRRGVLNDRTTEYPRLLCTVSGSSIKISKAFQWWANSGNWWARVADDAKLPANCLG
jgi:hypothetical protein